MAKQESRLRSYSLTESSALPANGISNGITSDKENGCERNGEQKKELSLTLAHFETVLPRIKPVYSIPLAH